MYKFVKIRMKYGSENKQAWWYFIPDSIKQVTEHFEKIFGQEIHAGIKDKMAAIEYNKHPETGWRHPGGQCLFSEYVSYFWFNLSGRDQPG